MLCNIAAPRRAHGGFTIIELMIAVIVLGVLTAIALPSYLDSVRKGRRADAVTRLQQVQQAQERHRANYPWYTSDFGLLGVNPMPSDGYYTLAIVAADTTGYTATATATSGTQVNDTKCRVLTLTQTGGNTAYTSTNASGSVDSSSRNACWNR